MTNLLSHICSVPQNHNNYEFYQTKSNIFNFCFIVFLCVFLCYKNINLNKHDYYLKTLNL